MTEASDHRRVGRAVVHKDGRPAATLTRGDHGTTFAYLPGYDGPAVATTLPVGAPPVHTMAGAVPPFFAGLLPEGRRLTALRRAVKTSADDELSLLMAVGGSTIGDVTVIPEGHDAAEPPALVTSSAFRFADLLSTTGVVDRVGLPGVQEKASGAMISLPVRMPGSHAIIKLDPPEYPGAVRNEHYVMGLARGLRQAVAQTELVTDSDGREGLVVPRFDRQQRDDGQVVSLAVEDACQLMGRYPADKYSVTSEDAGTVVRRTCAAIPVAALATLRLFAFSWLVGNGDLHAKNLSVLQGPTGEWRVAPFYDLLCTLAYGDRTMALGLAGRDRDLTRKAFRAFGAALGLPPRAVERGVDDALAATAPLLDDLTDGALPLDALATRTLVRQLARRRRDLEAA